MSSDLNKAVLQEAATQARGLAIDAVHKCSSGHLGLPLGCAEIGATLFGKVLSINPDKPQWVNRDRFILSAGHGSMFIYTWLHLAGYALSLEQLENFRVMDSETPGHPEFGDTVGVEATTGPLGQGVGNAVGQALACRTAAAKFNTNTHKIFDNHVVALAGDGCLQEGVAAEASAFAAHQKLDNLILFYDSNDVTLDAMADASQSEDVGARYEAYGYDVVTIDGHNLDAIASAYASARDNDNGKPKLIIAKTEIGRGIPEVAGTQKGHGEGGAKFAESARKGLGLPEETFYVSDDVKAYFTAHKEEQAAAYAEWEALYGDWKAANPALAEELEAYQAGKVPSTEELLAAIPAFDAEVKLATRKAGAEVLQPLAEAVPQLIGGSADLYGSTLNYIAASTDCTPATPTGRNVRYGIREHGMAAIMNGIAYHGLFRASGATFCVFADYLRPSLRVAALSHLPTQYILTHDSVGVGEDGPTHQPVETVSGLRVIPNLDVIRPADPEETAGAFVASFERTNGPTALILTRQALPTLNEIPVDTRRQGALVGGYVAVKESAKLERILLASGSEVQHAVEAAKILGPGTRVVSMPCFERFERQSESYKEEVLPNTCRNRVAIEAGVSGLWYQYVGIDGKVVGIDRFGMSAPGDQVMKALGITAEHLVEVAKS
ncbi:MAG: transketolase [Lentisphaeria bacterium]|nr:transketolase [Lentisphaeria bacterium]